MSNFHMMLTIPPVGIGSPVKPLDAARYRFSSANVFRAARLSNFMGMRDGQSRRPIPSCVDVSPEAIAWRKVRGLSDLAHDRWWSDPIAMPSSDLFAALRDSDIGARLDAILDEVGA